MTASAQKRLDALIAFVEKRGPKIRKRNTDGALIWPYVYELDEPWKTAVRKAKKASQR